MWGSIAEVEKIHGHVDVGQHDSIACEIQLVPCLVEQPVIALAVKDVLAVQDHCTGRGTGLSTSVHKLYCLPALGLSTARLVQQESVSTDRLPVAVVRAVEHVAEAHQLSHGQLLAVALIAGYVAVPPVTLEGAQGAVDIHWPNMSSRSWMWTAKRLLELLQRNAKIFIGAHLNA